MKNVTGYDIGVFESEDGFRCFGRDMELEGAEELHLYRVRLVLPELYVLAPTPEGAISQATCIGVEHVEKTSDDTLATDSATAERVSFGIRGWSGDQF